MLVRSLRDEEELAQDLVESEKSILKYFNDLITDGKQYQALYYLLQLQTEEYFQIGLSFLRKMQLGKLAKFVEKVAKERGVIVNNKSEI